MIDTELSYTPHYMHIYGSCYLVWRARPGHLVHIGSNVIYIQLHYITLHYML